jgi:hypothetical protein
MQSEILVSNSINKKIRRIQRIFQGIFVVRTKPRFEDYGKLKFKHVQNLKGIFTNIRNFHNSGKDLCEFRLIKQILWLQNLHHSTIFYESICKCSYSCLTICYLLYCFANLYNILLPSIYFRNVSKIK